MESIGHSILNGVGSVYTSITGRNADFIRSLHTTSPPSTQNVADDLRYNAADKVRNKVNK